MIRAERARTGIKVAPLSALRAALALGVTAWRLKVTPPARRVSKTRPVQLAVHRSARALTPAQQDLRGQQETVWHVCKTHSRFSRGAHCAARVVRILFRHQGNRRANVLLDLRSLMACAQHVPQTRPRLRVALGKRHVYVCWGILWE